MGATYAREGAGWVVTCAEHDWRWHVETEGHALNLLRKHDREWEHTTDSSGAPASIDLTKAAEYLQVVRIDHGAASPTRADSGPASSAYYAALDMWEAMTGLTGDAALAYAEACRSKPTTAVIPPF